MKKNCIERVRKLYTIEAIDLMADMFSFAQNSLKIEIKEYFNLFNKTKFSDRIYNLDPIFVCGKSAIEIVFEVLATNKMSIPKHDENKIYLPNVSEWVGIIVASYCFAKKISFKIFENLIDIDEIKKMYYPMHEAPHISTISLIDKIIKKKGNRLSIARTRAMISQNELALLSGVSLRSIQMYEQGHKDINKASFSTVRNLAYALNISIDELYDVNKVSNENLVTMY